VAHGPHDAWVKYSNSTSLWDWAETPKVIKIKNIEKVNVLKGEVAIEKYGEEANYGAIEVTTRKEKDTEE